VPAVKAAGTRSQGQLQENYIPILYSQDSPRVSACGKRGVIQGALADLEVFERMARRMWKATAPGEGGAVTKREPRLLQMRREAT